MNEMLGRLVATIMTIPGEWLGVLCDLAEKLASQRGSEWHKELKIFLRREPCWIAAEKKTGEVKVYLKRLYPTRVFTLNSCADDSVTENRLRQVFEIYLDPKLLHVRSKATGGVSAIVSKLVTEGKFIDFLGKTAAELEVRRIQWTQVVQFTETFKDQVHKTNRTNLFVCTEDGEPVAEDLLNVFVASVSCGHSGRLSVHKLSISKDNVWLDTFWVRVVSPQL